MQHVVAQVSNPRPPPTGPLGLGATRAGLNQAWCPKAREVRIRLTVLLYIQEPRQNLEMS
jgi:hypothetical protein